MVKLNLIDLQILHLGIKGNGRFDEKDMEESNLKKIRLCKKIGLVVRKLRTDRKYALRTNGVIMERQC